MRYLEKAFDGYIVNCEIVCEPKLILAEAG